MLYVFCTSESANHGALMPEDSVFLSASGRSTAASSFDCNGSFLTRDERRRLGLRTRPNVKWTLMAVSVGALAAVAPGGLGLYLYGQSPENWYGDGR